MNPQLTPRINRIEPNIIIDGGMELWLEGTSRSVANNTSAYGSALFQCQNLASGITLTNAQDAGVPSNTNLAGSNKVSKTASGSIGATTFTGLNYYVEGYDLSRIFKNECSLIFWVKSSVASNRSVSFRNVGSTHSYVRQYSIDAANTWELKVVKMPAMNTCPGAVDRTNGRGLSVVFGIVMGSNFQTATLNQWVAGSFTAGLGEDTTWLTGTTHDFSIAGAMLLPGDFTGLTAGTYDFVRAGANFEDELAKSQRFVEKIGGDITNTQLGAGLSTGTTSAIGVIVFKVTKRSTPNMTVSSVTGFRYNNASNNYVASNTTFNASSMYSTQIGLTVAGVAAGNIPGVFDSTGSAYIIADARF